VAGLPYRKIAAFLRAAFDVAACPGGLARAVGRVARKLEPTYESMLSKGKTSRQFAWESFWIEEWSGWSDIAHAREVEKKPMSERMRSVRFGFLDTGE
jgi:hypothetical protein